MALTTTDATFQKDVLESSEPVLVDFWAEWCGPCRMLGPVIDSVGKKMEGRAKVYKLNVDENPDTAMKYGITAIPMVILFRNGEAAQQFLGVKPEITYLNALQ